MKKSINYIWLLVAFLFGCSVSNDNVSYQGKIYTIRNSEFGVSIYDNRSLIYYINEDVYNFKSDYYCLISDRNNIKEWVVIKGETILDIDSTKLDFKRFKRMSKKALLER